MYVRNYHDWVELKWQTIYHTEDRAAVEAECARTQTGYRWREDGQLSTHMIRPAAGRHPRGGEMVWFNQAQHWHFSCLNAKTQDDFNALFTPENRPRNCFFGDGSAIEDSMMQEILGVYQELEIHFPWQKGDLVLVDNMLAAHARNPYAGPRKLLVSMGDMMTFASLNGSED